MSAGDLSARLQLKNNLHCKNFTWFIDNVWPELFIYNRDVKAWGSVRPTKHHLDSFINPLVNSLINQSNRQLTHQLTTKVSSLMSQRKVYNTDKHLLQLEEFDWTIFLIVIKTIWELINSYSERFLVKNCWRCVFSVISFSFPNFKSSFLDQFQTNLSIFIPE